MILGTYKLDLYCDVEGCAQSAHIDGDTFGKCAKKARKRGWTVRVARNQCLCPEHRRGPVRAAR